MTLMGRGRVFVIEVFVSIDMYWVVLPPMYCNE